ncbi:MAG: DNA-binding response regulator, partial [Bacteroidales bacterium]|nr:DNA-binding response regulator [Bacteroidales bacterium]
MDIDDAVEIHGPLGSVNKVVEELTTSNDYDLIFSDIRLVDGDVFEAFRMVMPKSFVIF